jgi:predicted Ser/Thr protein kinase
VLKRYSQYRTELGQFIDNQRVADHAASAYREAISATDDVPQIEGYEIKELIGVGGMGVVYRAYSNRFNHDVALKVMRGDRAFTPAHKQHFWKEAEIAFKLHNRGIVSVFDRGGYDDQPYYAMHFVNGKSLKQWLAEGGRWNEHEAKRLLIELAEGLTEAHRQGVVHRDLKPGNILIDDSDHKPWIIDFGLALVDDGPREAEGFVGTWGYAPPEQVRGDSHMAGPQADVYALGVILYEMLTGVQPFAGENPAQVKQRTLHEVPQWPKRRVPLRIEPRLASVCLKCLEKDPGQRFADAGQLGAALKSKAGYPIWPYSVYLVVSIACAALLQMLLLRNWGEPIAWVAFVVSLASVFVVLRSEDNYGLWPANVSERTLWAIWGGVVLAIAVLSVGIRLYTLDFVHGFHLTFALMPFLAGVGFFAMCTEFSGRNLHIGLGWMVTGFAILSFVPVPWAITAYIVFNSLCVVLKVTELLLDRRVRQGIRSP